MTFPDLKIGALAAAYRSGGLDPVAVASAVHARALECAGENIWITLRDSGSLRADAAAIAARWPDPDARPPLYGVPVAIKDNIDVAGLPTTAACADFAYVPASSAFLVRRLTEAGALIVGKTNLDQFATGLTGTRSPYGVCRSAFNPEYIAGGSSSGSGLALVRGLASVAVGTDTAGSGRVPAAFSGTVGLKPSRGLVSARGVVPACRSLDCPSVFALSVDDAWATLRVIAGFDAADAWSREFPPLDSVPLDSLGLESPGLRVGVADGTGLGHVTDDEIAAAYRAAAGRLTAAGLPVAVVDITPLLKAADLLYGGPFVSERLTHLSDLLAGSPESFFPDTREILLAARGYSAADAFGGMHRLAELRRAAEPLWQSVDAVLLPTVPCVPTVKEALADSFEISARLGRYTNFTNLMDLAAIAVPAGSRGDGLPVSVTFHGPAGSDRALAGLASLLAAAAG